MVKKQESSKEEEERCINPSVFQEYIAEARLACWHARLLLFQRVGSRLFQLHICY